MPPGEEDVWTCEALIKSLSGFGVIANCEGYQCEGNLCNVFETPSQTMCQAKAPGFGKVTYFKCVF